MLGAGFQLTRGRHGDDPFYTSAKTRRANQRIDQLRRAQSDVSNVPSSAPSPHKQQLEPSDLSSSNLDRFLESVTPSVPAQFLSKVYYNLYFYGFFFNLSLCCSLMVMVIISV